LWGAEGSYHENGNYDRKNSGQALSINAYTPYRTDSRGRSFYAGRGTWNL